VAARFILVVLALTSFHFMLQLITILNSHEERLTPEDENAGPAVLRVGRYHRVAGQGKAETVIGVQSRILNWPRLT
jgi:hypothetical protein